MKDGYTIERKSVAKGKKTKVTIKLHGEVIGERTSVRPYCFALVVTRNQAFYLQRAKENLEYTIKKEREYRAIANDEPGARHRFINFLESNGRPCSAWSVQCHEMVNEWADSSLKEIANLKSGIEHLSAGPDPEFSKPRVLSWHSGKIPATPEWAIFYDVVDLITKAQP